MRSLVLTHDGLNLADTPMPSVLPGDVRIEVRAVGISQIDLAIWKGEINVALPLILGHEISGIIHESSHPDLELGTPVTTEIDVTCGRCWHCLNGIRSHCINKSVLGLTTDGGLAEFLSVPGDLVHPLPEEVDMVSGTFTSPVASAIQTVLKTSPQEDEVVVVMGCGKIGLLVAQAYDAYGAAVYVVGRNQFKLGVGRRIGLRNVLAVDDPNWKERVLDATNGIGPRIVVEATGSLDGLKNAISLVRNGGIVALKSLHHTNLPIFGDEIVNREITIIGTSRGPFDLALDMLDKGRIEVKELVNARFSLEEGAKAFEYASRPEVTKVIINL